MTRVKTFRFLPFILSLFASVWMGCTDLSQLEDPNQRVGINTLRDPFHKSDKPCGPYPSYYLEYLDDTQCKKVLPSNRDRNFQCPIQNSLDRIMEVPGYTPATSPSAPVEVDSTALLPFVDKDVSLTLILIRRVNGVPYYRYLSNGTHNQIRELWSSSKFLGILNASESLRYTSDGQIGLDGSIDKIPLGDLATVVHNYDEREYTSNSLMYWFHDIGGRYFANQLLHQRWLNRPEEEVYGANYGAGAPELGFNFNLNEQKVEITQDQGWIKGNLLSTFSLAEALKRVVMYRENPETQLEYSTWEDIQVLLYGASNSIWYDSKTPQGMESDPSVYMQEAVDIDQIEANTQGQWRIFSKLGLGFARGGEIVHTDYACLPVLDPDGEPILDQGVEMVLSIHTPVYDQHAQGDQNLARIYKRLVQGVLSGEIR